MKGRALRITISAPSSAQRRSGAAPVASVLVVILLIAAASLAGAYFAIPAGASSGGQLNLTYKLYTIPKIISAAYKVYANPSLGVFVGKLLLTNNGTSPAYNVQVRWNIQNYAHSEVHKYPVIGPGSTVVDLFYPELPSSVVSLTTPVPTRVSFNATYTSSSTSQNAQVQELSDDQQISILGGHDYTFSDIPATESTGSWYDLTSNNALWAVFVTPTDPVVRQYADMANRLAGGAPTSLSDDAAMKSLTAIWDLSGYNGIKYKTEPQAFWTGTDSQYVYFPRDVLQDKIGTCLDTTLFFASVAMALGLKAYAYSVPGHAFPVVQLPISGQMLPIESTELGNNIAFTDALKIGLNWSMPQTNGPNRLIDFQALQSAGVLPPELPQLPTDALQSWKIGLPGEQNQNTGAGVITTTTTTLMTTTTNTGGGNQGRPTYVNQSPKWSVSYPSGWQVGSQQQLGSISYVPFTTQDNVELDIGWVQGYAASSFRSAFEQLLGQSGTFRILNDTTGKLGSLQANTVAYQGTVSSTGQQVLFVAHYSQSQGYAYAAIYDVPIDNLLQQNVQAAETIVLSFAVGGG